MELREKELRVSRACILAFLASDSLDVGIARLCECAGISHRTFHRYFATKPQVIRPYFDEITRQFGAILLQSQASFQETAELAFREAVLSAEPSSIVELMRLLQTRKEYWGIFLEVVDASERDHAAFLRQRYPDMSEKEVMVMSVGLVASSRLALLAALDGRDAAHEFSTYLQLFLTSNGPPRPIGEARSCVDESTESVRKIEL